MAQVILLNDVSESQFNYGSRYVAPYVLAEVLENNGFNTIVIDHFTHIPDFFNYLKNFIGTETLFVGLATTFLSPRIPPSIDRSTRDVRYDNFMSHYLWLDTAESMRSWLTELRSTLSGYNPDCKIVLGGSKAGRPIDCGMGPHNPYNGLIDYLILGYAEEAVLHLAQSLAQKKAVENFSHTGFKIINRFKKRDERYTPSTFFKRKHAVLWKESLPIEITRGCSFNCKYCFYDKSGSALKDLNSLKAEFIHNYEMFGTTNYNFSDDCFNDSRKKVESVCNTILGLPFKINWTSFARADLAVTFPETLDLMINSGAKGLYFGIESFNTPVAKKVGKGMPAERIKEMLVEARKRHFENCLFQGAFISGLPGDNEASLQETMDWLLANPVLDFVSVGTLVVGQFNASADNLTTDYSDISKNPEKYGFTKVTHNPEWWEHHTMDKAAAEKMTKSLLKQWLAAGHDNSIGGIWAVNSMFTLGYDWEQIKQMARNPATKHRYYEEKINRFEEYLARYCAELVSVNKDDIKYGLEK